MKKILDIDSTQDRLWIDSNITYTQVPGWLHQVTRDLHLSVIKHDKNFDGTKYPVIFWFAGGAWMDIDYNIHLANLIDYARKGFVVVDVEYRDSNKAHFPSQLQDAKAAIRYIKSQTEKYQIDPNKIVAMGESAGGYLATMLGVTNSLQKFDIGSNLEYTSDINLAIPWSGVVDPLTTMQSTTTDTHDIIYQNLLGKRPDQALTLNKRANPLTYINQQTVPFLILHGTKDVVVPLSNAEELSNKLTENKILNELIVIKDAQHMDQKFWQPDITNLITKFIYKNI